MHNIELDVRVVFLRNFKRRMRIYREKDLYNVCRAIKADNTYFLSVFFPFRVVFVCVNCSFRRQFLANFHFAAAAFFFRNFRAVVLARRCSRVCFRWTFLRFIVNSVPEKSSTRLIC